MKNLLFILLFPVSVCFAQQTDVRLSDVPDYVIKSFNKLYPEHGDSCAWSINQEKHFVVHTNLAKHKAMIVFNSDGDFVLSVEKITYAAFSDSAKAYFKKRHFTDSISSITFCDLLKFNGYYDYEMICGDSKSYPKTSTCMNYPDFSVPEVYYKEGAIF